MSDLQFTNLLGSTYRNGNLGFTSDGTSLVVPIGNRICLYNFKTNRTRCFETNNKNDISNMAISNNNSLITVDKNGHCVYSSLNCLLPIHYFNFNSKVRSIKFTECSKYISASIEKSLVIYHCPPSYPEFRPFLLYRKIKNLTNDVISHDYSFDSKIIVVACKNMMLHLVYFTENNETLPLLRAYKNELIDCYFEKDGYNLFVVDKKGYIIKWIYDSINNSWMKEEKIEFKVEKANVKSCNYHKKSSILVLGYDNGVFSVIDYKTMSKIVQLGLQQCRIDYIGLCPVENWVVIANKANNSIIVWDYKSESFVLKQHGKALNMRCASFSPNGVQIVSGFEDGSIRVYDIFSGFCLITFENHKSKVTGIKFASNGQFFASCSVDGTCRLFDMNRYRNFRILVAPNPIQFSCIAIDAANEFVCAGSLDEFNIYVWAVSSGNLLEILSGHTSPVSSVSFIMNSTKLVSCSWDESARIIDILKKDSPPSIISTNSEILCVATNPSKPYFAICNTRCCITIIDSNSDNIVGLIEGSKDLGLSRGINDVMTATSSLHYRYFTHICYTYDGEYLLACGKSKYICIYDSFSHVLLNRIETTINQSFDNILAKLNSQRMTEAGPIESLAQFESSEEEYIEEKSKIPIPGSLKNDISTRKTKPEYQLLQVCACPTGNSIGCVSNDGFLIFSKDEKFLFDPINIDDEITTSKILELIENNHIEKAILYSLQMNEKDLILKSIERVPYSDISYIASKIPIELTLNLLDFISTILDECLTPHFEFYITWCNILLTTHALAFKTYFSQSSLPKFTIFRRIQKVLTRYNHDLGKLCESNTYKLKYLMSVPSSSIPL